MALRRPIELLKDGERVAYMSLDAQGQNMVATFNLIAGAPHVGEDFLSTVSDEFRVYRDQLRSDLTRHNVEVKVQEDFKDLGGDTLDKLDVYIAHC